MPPKFGTSGLRGLVTDLTDDLVRAYVRAFLAACAQGKAVHVGWDLRPSSPAIADAVMEAVCAAGLDAVDHGAIPTPALALASMSARDAAVMITGSHIPADRNGLKFYVPSGEVSKTDETAILAALETDHPDAATRGRVIPTATALPAYVARYADAFGPQALAGLRIGVYEHSSVARDVMGEIMRALGAQTVSLARSDVFIPVDTEAVDPATRGLLAGWAAEHGLDAIVSTDGDSDRPMLADATGGIVAGDLLGPVTALFLGADTLITPVSSNTLIDHMAAFTSITRTRIGSPFVIAAMEEALARDPATKIAGYEANGGFLLGFTAAGPAGPLPPLMTRDSLLPLVAPLADARAKGQTLADLIAALPPRFTAADRIQDVPTEKSAAFIGTMTSGAQARAGFFEGVGAEQSLDLTDGLRVTFDCGAVVHLRPSGNAPECRCYVEADSTEKAQVLLTRHMAALRRYFLRDQPDQILRIGAYTLALPPEHHLPAIMANHPHYDVLYWDVIGALLAENGLSDTCQLIDIGANVGDSAAHFRRHSSGPIWAIEAHPAYFAYLERNTAQMDNIRLSRAIVTPAALAAKISLVTADGTGLTQIDADHPYEGDRLFPAQIMAAAQPACVLKSDTDGFDGHIIKALAAQMPDTVWPSIVTFEGHTIGQIKRGENSQTHAALVALMKQGYRVQVVLNTGLPVMFLGANIPALNWHFTTQRNCVQAGAPLAAYFDYICIAPGLSTHTLDFAPGGLL
jgi:phosphomannomutase